MAAAQKTNEISLPDAITVFPEDVYRAPETWARRASRNLIYFHEVDRGARGVGAAGAVLCRAAGGVQTTANGALITGSLLRGEKRFT